MRACPKPGIQLPLIAANREGALTRNYRLPNILKTPFVLTVAHTIKQNDVPDIALTSTRVLYGVGQESLLWAKLKRSHFSIGLTLLFFRTVLLYEIQCPKKRSHNPA